MSIEALWSVTFVSTTGQQLNAGNGVVVLETGRVLGGDSAFTYIGHYSANPKTDLLEAEIRVRKYGETPMQSVFGPMNDFHLVLTGKPLSHNAIRFEGHIKEHPQLQIVIAAQRQAELP
ncbi:T3SS negative regulator,GrlR [compost metagenome]